MQHGNEPDTHGDTQPAATRPLLAVINSTGHTTPRVRLVAALNAVVAEHRPDAEATACQECSDERDVRWPCPTLRVMAEALGVELEQ